MLEFSWKRSQVMSQPVAHEQDQNLLMAEKLLIENDLDSPNFLWDNILYYVAGFLVRSLLARLQCNNCKTHSLLDPTDRHALKMPVYPWYAKFTEFKQKGGLIFPSLSVIKIVKATEVAFQNRIIDKGIGVTIERNLRLKIQNAVLESIGNGIFGDSLHYYDHTIGETDHFSTLVKMVTKRYL